MAATLMPKKEEAPAGPSALSRRENQVMDILHRRTGATVAEIMADLPDPPTYSAVRSVLRILGEKGLIKHREDGPRYIYYPAQSTETAREDVLAHVVRTYFGDSPEQAMTALLRMSDADMSDADVKRLRAIIGRARQSGR
ncbi:MAG TPA: BlaI/MecI/CopY family transcriptional regulator [Gemmatimonadaceae bacterium]|jgi:BlaI family transcriptional regulator, penicillinase repressor|nr:BlaI/MecI/CopY family transcriptional regulator [Gemmatimonadaceae bacterium]